MEDIFLRLEILGDISNGMDNMATSQVYGHHS